MASHRKFRILALDGGGIRGLISARILQDVEKQIWESTGETINTYFDLIAGTSTGSILAAGLVMGIKPDRLLDLYLQEGLRIFPRGWQLWFRQHILSLFYGAKYSNDGLKYALQKTFQEHVHSLRPDLPKNYNIKFGEIHQCLYGQEDAKKRAKLLILAHNTLQRQTTFFNSPSVDVNPWYAERELWEVCVSSAAAPTFFPPYCFQNSGLAVKGAKDTHPIDRKDYTYIDGGVSANTPSLAALVHAIDIENRSLNDVAVLSIGTGRTTAPYECDKISKWGALGWVGALADVFMGSQIQISADLCSQILRSCNEPEPEPHWNYLRLQFPLNERMDGEGNLLPEAEQYNSSLYQYLLETYRQKPGSTLTEDEIKLKAQTEAKLSEEMDNASPENLAQLLSATAAFLADKRAYRYQCDLNIQQSIAQFITYNGEVPPASQSAEMAATVS